MPNCHVMILQTNSITLKLNKSFRLLINVFFSFSQLSAVLNFLCSVPGPSGEPALHFVMTEWVVRQHVFYGSYEKKVSIIALAKLLQHGVMNNDTRLQVKLIYHMAYTNY